MPRYLLNDAPHLASEWDFEKNSEVNINIVAAGSDKKYWWFCSNGHSYYSSPHARTIKRSGCKTCFVNSRRIYDKAEVEKLRNATKPKKETLKIGDETEIYIVNLLQNTGFYKKVEKLGNLNGKSDVCVTHYDETKNQLQVKTLIRRKNRPDSYCVKTDKKYDSNMLIVMVNKERTRFALEFSGKIKMKGLVFSFKKEERKYKDISYTDEKVFLSKLQELIPKSCEENELSQDNLKEVEMLQRFEIFCNIHSITYSRNTVNTNPVDGYINGYRFQAKYVSKNKPKKFTYQINSCKSAGKINGKIIKRNYTDEDFDYFIIEIGGTIENPTKYKSNFLIIPAEILVERGVLKTKTQEGKINFKVCPPDYGKHWSKKFWNVIPDKLISPKYKFVESDLISLVRSSVPTPKLKIITP